MGKKLFLLPLFLTILSYRLCYSEECLTELPVGSSELKFQALNQNEKFAYQMSYENTIKIFAMSLGGERRLIGTWKEIFEWGLLQFTKDRRKCFFMKLTDPSIYMLDGEHGTLKNVIAANMTYITTADGKYIVFNDENSSDASTLQINIYNIETSTLVVKKWQIDIENVNSCNFRRENNNDEIIRMIITAEGGWVLIEEKINIKNATIGDRVDYRREKIRKKISNKIFWDSIVLQPKDPTLSIGASP